MQASGLSPGRFKRVYIEISNVCNLQCHFCPEVEREKHFMQPELFTRVIKEVGPRTEFVTFHLMGEPLGHPRFQEYVEICAAENVPVQITTNGTLLNDSRAGTLLNPIIKQVNFSVHSFEANFPGKDVTAYLDKLFGFIERAQKEHPDLYINFRLWNLNQTGSSPVAPDSLNETVFRKIRERFNAEFRTHADVRWKKGVNVTGRFYLHFDTRFEWPHPVLPRRSEKGFCWGLTSHIGILADGRVVPCCLDKEGRLTLGDCSSQNINEILDGVRARSMRDGFQQGLLVEDLCRRCTFVSRFDAKARSLNPA